MRVVSLLPAATEIVAALGMLDHLVGVSHECDFPPAVHDLPRITRCAIHGNALPSADIDRWVKTELERTGTLYTMDETLLRRLAPDVIITQRLCDVCAVGYGTVTAFAATLPGSPEVVNLEPQTLAEVFGDVRRVAAALGVPERAAGVIAPLEARVERVRTRAAGAAARRCVLLEWIDPPFRSGHWGPELVALAGGVDPVGRAGEDAMQVPWDVVRDAAPEVLVAGEQERVAPRVREQCLAQVRSSLSSQTGGDPLGRAPIKLGEGVSRFPSPSAPRTPAPSPPRGGTGSRARLRRQRYLAVDGPQEGRESGREVVVLR